MSNTTGDQRRSYRQYSGDLSPAQLARYFHLDTADRESVDARRAVRTTGSSSPSSCARAACP